MAGSVAVARVPEALGVVVGVVDQPGYLGLWIILDVASWSGHLVDNRRYGHPAIIIVQLARGNGLTLGVPRALLADILTAVGPVHKSRPLVTDCVACFPGFKLGLNREPFRQESFGVRTVNLV